MYKKGELKTFVDEKKVPTIKELAGDKLIDVNVGKGVA